MNDIPRQKIKEFISIYGLSLCDEPLRCKGLLLDSCGQYRREINLLVNALEEHIPRELLNASKGTPYESLRNRLVRRLHEDRGLVEDYASWAVDSWALALGVISDIPNPDPDPTLRLSPSMRTSLIQDSSRTQGQSGILITSDNGNSPTATAQAITNANATATTSVIAVNPLPVYLSNSGNLSGILAFKDALKQRSNWSNSSNASGGICQFSNGVYQVSESKIHIIHPCEASMPFSNFAFEVQMDILQGDCGGIIFRDNGSFGKNYIFEICQNGCYSLFLFTDNHDSTVLNSTSGCPTLPSGENTIAVVANGIMLSLYINEQKVGSTNDSTYKQGFIGLIAGDESNTTKVAYSNARVWKL